MTEPADDLKDLAAGLVVQKVLADRVQKSGTEMKNRILAGADAGDRKTAKLSDESVLGTVSVAHGRKSASVTDVKRLTDWVSENLPTEVEVVYEARIRASFLKVLLAAVRDRGGWLDRTTGQLTELPGVEVTEGADYIVIKPAADADALVEQAWRNGELDIRAALQIEGPS